MTASVFLTGSTFDTDTFAAQSHRDFVSFGHHSLRFANLLFPPWGYWDDIRVPKRSQCLSTETEIIPINPKIFLNAGKTGRKISLIGRKVFRFLWQFPIDTGDILQYNSYIPIDLIG